MGKVAAVSLVIETKDTAKRLAEIDFELDSIGKKLREAKKAGQQDVYAGLKQQQAALRTEAREVNKALRDQSIAFQQAAKNIPKDSLAGLTTQYRELRRQIDLLSESQRKSDFGQKLISQARGIKSQIDRIGDSVGDFRSRVGDYRGALNDFFSTSNLLGGNLTSIFSGLSKAALAGTVVSGLVQGTKALFDLNKEISSLQASVQKTTGLTEAQVNSLTESLKDLDTVTTIEDLLTISQIAGRLGVQGEKGVLEFTKAIEKLSIALGDEFTGGAEQITDEVGRLSNVLFGATQDGVKLADNVLGIGNALNVLAANGASTAPVITDFATRISGLAVPLGVSAGEILGISATLQEFGVTAERGGTAIGRIFKTLAEDPQAFAKELKITKETLKEAGFDVNSFSDLVNTDLVGALQFASTRLLELNGNNTELSDSLKELGINGAGELEVLLKLGQGNERLSQNINTANKSLENQNSLTSEVATRQENLAGVTARLTNNTRELFVSSEAEGFFTAIVSGANNAVKSLSEFGALIKQAREGSSQFDKTLTFLGDSFVAIFGQGGKFKNAVNQAGRDLRAFFTGVNSEISAEAQAATEKATKESEDLTKFAASAVASPVVKLQQELSKLQTQAALNPLSTSLQKQILDVENKIYKARIQASEATNKKVKEDFKSISDQIGTIAAEVNKVAANSIAGLEKQIADLRQKAEESPNSTLFAKYTQQANELQQQLDITSRTFKLLSLGFTDQSIQQKISVFTETALTSNLDQVGPPPGEQERQAELDKIKAFEEDKRKIQEDIAQGTEEGRAELNRQANEQIKAELKQRGEIYADFYDELGAGLASFTQSTLEGQQDAFKEFSKGIVITALEAVEKLIQLQLAQAFGISLAQPDSIATLGASGLIKFAIISGLIKGFFGAIKSQVSNFDQGGQIPTITGSRVTDPQNIPTQPGGDNVLAMVRRGEVVLNDGQQRRLFQYAGPDVFRRIGVPGFQTGGLIGTPQILNPNVSVSVPGASQSGVDEATFQKFAALIGREVAAQVGPAVEAGFMSAEEKNYRRKQLKNDTTV